MASPALAAEKNRPLNTKMKTRWDEQCYYLICDYIHTLKSVISMDQKQDKKKWYSFFGKI